MASPLIEFFVWFAPASEGWGKNRYCLGSHRPSYFSLRCMRLLVEMEVLWILQWSKLRNWWLLFLPVSLPLASCLLFFCSWRNLAVREKERGAEVYERRQCLIFLIFFSRGGTSIMLHTTHNCWEKVMFEITWCAKRDRERGWVGYIVLQTTQSSLLTLYILACLVIVTVGDLGLCRCTCVTSFQH